MNPKGFLTFWGFKWVNGLFLRVFLEERHMMVNSAGTEIYGPRLLGIFPTSDDDDDKRIKATMDLVKAHVRLILLGTLSMSESKSVLTSAFLALDGFDL